MSIKLICAIVCFDLGCAVTVAQCYYNNLAVTCSYVHITVYSYTYSMQYVL